MLKHKSLFKSLALFGLVAVVVTATAAEAPTKVQPAYGNYAVAANTVVAKTVPLATKPSKASAALEMMSSTVRLHVQVEYTKMSRDEDGGVIEQHDSNAWAGSGVVYDKTDRADGPVRSRILTANHVLQTPAVGSVEDEIVPSVGISMHSP